MGQVGRHESKIKTLLHFLAGENTGSGLDNSALSLLSLQQSYPFGGAGAGSGGVQIALSPGQSYAGQIYH